MKITLQGVIASMAIFWISQLFGQTNLNFNSATATSEGAIRLSWNSTTNEVYEIDYADSLVDTNTGSITWLPLYTEYPSHGTNTFVADCGNYDLSPEIVHPRLAPMRFYRVSLVGTNTSPTNPMVSISFPTNGASLSGAVTMMVSSSSDEILTEVKLFIDGEQQWTSGDGTNFFINTCEWANGLHTIFATAKSESSMEGLAFNNPVTFGRSVSSYVTVSFDNLITSLDFSEPFFEPSEGQTQRVSAVFTANVNWTLEIQNANSNDVRYVSGSGGSMVFNWDGTGTNGASIPDGIYTYLLTVQTNGAPLPSFVGGTTNSGPPGPSFASFSSVNDSGPNTVTIQLPPLPPGLSYGLDEEGNPITNKTVTITRPVASLQSTYLSGSSFSADALSGDVVAGASYASNTQHSRGPYRKPRVGVKNKSGTFGFCYKTYPNGFAAQEPRTGWPSPLPVFVAIDNKPAGPAAIGWSALTAVTYVAQGFSDVMKIGSFKPKFVLADDQWNGPDIKKESLGGRNIFNTCNFGVLLTHGCYGATPEKDNVKYTYLALYNNKFGLSSYVKLSDMDLGSLGANGLRWMTILSCDMFHPANITSMANNGLLPDNSNLHLFQGFSTTTYANPYLGFLYASNLVTGISIPDSLVNAATQAFSVRRAGMTNSVSVRTMGYNSCISDTLYLWSDPDPNTTYRVIDTSVYTYP